MSEISPRVYDAPDGVDITEAVYRGDDFFLGSGKRDFRLALIETPEIQALAIDYSDIQPEKMNDAPYRGVRDGSYFVAPEVAEIKLSVGPRGNFSGLDMSFPAGYVVTPYGTDRDNTSRIVESFRDSIVEAIDEASKEPLDARADDWMR